MTAYNRLVFIALFLFLTTLMLLVDIGPPCSDTIPAPSSFAYPRKYTPFPYVMNHPSICEKGDPVKLMILVISSPTNFEVRQAIRKTWGTIVELDPSVRLAFLLGMPTSGASSGSNANVDSKDAVGGKVSIQNRILEENSWFGDVIQEDFDDTYSNLTLKTVMMLKWLTTFCPNTRFALKIDDDCFLNPVNLLRFLESQTVTAAPPAAIFGNIFSRTDYRRPHRCTNDKVYISKEEFDGDLFPVYINGVSYILTANAIPRLYDAVLKRPLIHLEDVFLTGFCAVDAGVVKINSNDIGVTKLEPPVCVPLWYPNLITFHHLSLQQSDFLWKQFLDPTFDPCQK